MQTLLVAVGSCNPVKVAAASAVVRHAWPAATVAGVQVTSTVADQPWGDDETIRGALARAQAARLASNADIGIGIEGGVVNAPAGLRTCAWAAVVARDGREYIGGSLSMPLPPDVEALVRQGMELGHAMDTVSGEHNTKHAAGAVGLLTAGFVNRQAAYESLVAYALAPLMAPQYWPTLAAAQL